MLKIEKENKNFPNKLREIKQAPQLLYALGNTQLLSTKCIAIVGSRSPTEYGERMAKKFTKELCEYGFTIVSGMACGIDSIAHITAIKNGGNTIAVLPCGFENIYPKENIELFKEIIEAGGCALTEYLPEESADGKKFVNRNRIVAGLSIGVLIVEGAYRSGTQITGKDAIKNGKKVFCIPSSLDNPRGFAPNYLIRCGGVLVTDAKDILQNIEEKEWQKVKLEPRKNIIQTKEKTEEQSEKNKKIKNETNIEVPKEYEKIYKIIKANQDKIHITEIAKKAEIPIEEINYQLTMLEIEGAIIQLPRKAI